MDEYQGGFSDELIKEIIDGSFGKKYGYINRRIVNTKPRMHWGRNRRVILDTIIESQVKSFLKGKMNYKNILASFLTNIDSDHLLDDLEHVYSQKDAEKSVNTHFKLFYRNFYEY